MNNNSHRVGYARVSTAEQTLDLQVDALHRSRCAAIYKETASGKSADRKMLKACIKKLRAGDTLVVWRLDRLGRSVHDLVTIMKDLEQRHVYFESLTEKIETQSYSGKLIFHMFAALAEFERNLIQERTRAGLLAAKKRGRVGGRRPVLNERQVKEVLNLRESLKLSVAKIAARYKVSRMTIYNILKQHKVDKKASKQKQGFLNKRLNSS